MRPTGSRPVPSVRPTGRPGSRQPRAWVLVALWLAAMGPAAAQSAGQGRGGSYDPCADLGSFAVVDGAPVPRGQPLVAQPYQPCADLPGRPQPQVFIDAQVQVGGEQDPTGSQPPAGGQRPFPRRR